MQGRRKAAGSVRARIVGTGALVERVRQTLSGCDWADLPADAGFDEALASLLAGGDDALIVAPSVGGRPGVELLAEARLAGVEAPALLLADDEASVDPQVLELGAADAVTAAELAAGALPRRLRQAVVSGRLLAEAEASARRLRTLHDEARRLVERAGPLLLVDGRGIARFANGGAEDLLGAGLVGRSPPLPVLLAGAGEFEVPTEGRRRVLRAEAEPMLWGGAAATSVRLQDVTDARLARRALDRLRPQATAGRLAAPVNHDLQTCLQIALGAVEALRELDGLPAGAHEPLEAIEQAALRGSDLGRRLVAFGRRDVGRESRFDLVRRCFEHRELARSLAGPDARLELIRDATRLEVFADPVLIDEALLSLVANAVEATRGAGTIRVSLRESNAHAELAVVDEGAGMAPSVLARAREPFFTTRRKGRAAGLGLSLVDEVARRAGGSLELRSIEGEGTTAVLRLPLAPPEAPAVSTTEELAAVDPGRYSILVADPEGPARRVVAQSLQRAGYRVTAVDDDDAAAARLRDEAFDVVVLGGDCDGLLQRTRQLRPAAGVVRLGAPGQAPPSDDPCVTLDRPVRLAQLMRSVRSLLSP